jgi:hypothetical protein
MMQALYRLRIVLAAGAAGAGRPAAAREKLTGEQQLAKS